MRAFACRECGQLTAMCDVCPAPVDSAWCPCGRDLCERCRPSYGKGQELGVAERLFNPGGPVMPGQLGLDVPGT